MPEVVLRSVEDADLATFFEHEKDPYSIHMAAFTADDPSDHAAFLAHWTRIRANPKVVLRTILTGQEIAGHVASFLRGEDREVTYWVGRSFWGRGVATAALRAFLGETRERPIHARVAKDNLASRRVLEKCGFVVAAEERGFANARGAEIDELVLRLA